MQKINLLGMLTLARKFIEKPPIITKWDAVPFSTLSGGEYWGQARWFCGKIGCIGEIGLSPSLALETGETIARVWLHEVGHIALGHLDAEWLNGAVSVETWVQYREPAANRYAAENMGKLQTMIEADGYDNFSEFVRATPGEWWNRGRDRRRIERAVSGAVAASLAGRNFQPQRPGTVGSYRVSAQ